MSFGDEVIKNPYCNYYIHYIIYDILYTYRPDKVGSNTEEISDTEAINHTLLQQKWTQITSSYLESSKMLNAMSLLTNLTYSKQDTEVANLLSLISNLNFVPLDRYQVDHVEKFVLFIGYPRSGHSIIGTMMDSHPNMIIANEFQLVRALMSEASRRRVTKPGLYNALYLNSRAEMVYGERGKEGLKRKGYLLAMNSSFQGHFDSKITIIGNKEGGATTKHYHAHPARVTAALKWLKHKVGIPIHVLHVVRNPYDMVATHALYVAGEGGRKYEASEAKKLDNPPLLENTAKQIFFRAEAVTSMTKLLNLRVLLIHHEDMVNEPKQTMLQICKFLKVNCTEDYLESCKEKAYHSVSRTRDLVVWTQHLRERVDSEIKHFTFFSGYTFHS